MPIVGTGEQEGPQQTKPLQSRSFHSSGEIECLQINMISVSSYCFIETSKKKATWREIKVWVMQISGRRTFLAGNKCKGLAQHAWGQRSQCGWSRIRQRKQQGMKPERQTDGTRSCSASDTTVRTLYFIPRVWSRGGTWLSVLTGSFWLLS